MKNIENEYSTSFLPSDELQKLGGRKKERNKERKKIRKKKKKERKKERKKVK